MKKVLLVAILAVFFIASSTSSYAEQKGSTKNYKEEKGSKRGSMKDKKFMHCMMMKKMMSKKMVASGDGGVIVLVGNKLLKYDKDLNLVKEAEIKIDMEAYKAKMKECYLEQDSE